ADRRSQEPIPSCSCDDGKKGPPENGERQHAPGTKAVAKPSAWDLKERIAYEKRAKNPADLHLAELVLGHDVLGGDRNAHAIDDHEHVNAEEQGHDQPAGASGSIDHIDRL